MNSILLSLSATALGLSLLCGAVSLREKVRVKRLFIKVGVGGVGLCLWGWGDPLADRM